MIPFFRYENNDSNNENNNNEANWIGRLNFFSIGEFMKILVLVFVQFSAMQMDRKTICKIMNAM